MLTIGYVVAALGLLATAATAAAAGAHLQGWELAPPLLIAGLGQGLGMRPLVGTIIAGLRPAEAGAAFGARDPVSTQPGRNARWDRRSRRNPVHTRV